MCPALCETSQHCYPLTDIVTRCFQRSREILYFSKSWLLSNGCQESGGNCPYKAVFGVNESGLMWVECDLICLCCLYYRQHRQVTESLQRYQIMLYRSWRIMGEDSGWWFSESCLQYLPLSL